MSESSDQAEITKKEDGGNPESFIDKKLNEKMEKARIDLRQVREVIKSAIEKAFVDKDIAEDDKFRFIKDLDEEINQQNEALKTVREAKEKEIMTV